MISLEDAPRVQHRIKSALLQQSFGLFDGMLKASQQRRSDGRLPPYLEEGNDSRQYWVSLICEQRCFSLDFTFTPEEGFDLIVVTDGIQLPGEDSAEDFALNLEDLDQACQEICRLVEKLLGEKLLVK